VFPRHSALQQALDKLKVVWQQSLETVFGRSLDPALWDRFAFQQPIPSPVRPAPAFVVVDFQSLPSVLEHSSFRG